MTNVPLTLVLSILNVLECQDRISVVFYITYIKQIQYDKDATYIGTIHSECYKVSMISVALYKITYMKQIEHDNYTTSLVPSILNVTNYITTRTSSNSIQ